MSDKTTVLLPPAGLGYVVNQIRRAGVTPALFSHMDGIPRYWVMPPLIDDREVPLRRMLVNRKGAVMPPDGPSFEALCGTYRRLYDKSHPLAEFLLLSEQRGGRWLDSHLYLSPRTVTDLQFEVDDLHILCAGLAIFAHENSGGNFVMDSGTRTIACTLRGQTLGLIEGRPVGVKSYAALSDVGWNRLLFQRREYPATGINSGLVKMQELLEARSVVVGRVEECLDMVYLAGIFHRRPWGEDSSGNSPGWHTACEVFEEKLFSKLSDVKSIHSRLEADKLSRYIHLTSEKLQLLEQALAVLDDPALGDVYKFRSLEQLLCPTVISKTKLRRDLCGKPTLVGEPLTAEMDARIRSGIRTLTIKERGVIATKQEELNVERYREHQRHGAGKRSEIQPG